VTNKAESQKQIPDFSIGDTVLVHSRVEEGGRQRIHPFQGVVIKRKNSGFASTFTVRKISYGEGLEKTFPLHSPTIEDIKVLRKGKVRRAKMYYLRSRVGKATKIREKGK